jgi:hypothetical protein
MKITKTVCISVAALVVAFFMTGPVGAALSDTVLTRVTQVRTKVNEVLTSLREGRNQVGSNFKSSINEAIQTAKTTVNDEKEGLDDFVVSGCNSFKISTNDMLMASQDAVTSALNLANVNVGLFKTERARDKINSAQCRLLYPVYRAVGQSIEEAQADITASANATAAGFDRLKGLLDDATKPLDCKSGDAAICAVLVSRKCSTYVRNAPEIHDILDVGKKTVTALKVSAKVADAAGKIGVWKAAVAVWGWVGSDIEFNLPEFLSATTGAVAVAIEQGVTKQRTQLDACVDLYAKDKILGKQNRMLSKITKLQPPT